jgi:hypothetical protein
MEGGRSRPQSDSSADQLDSTGGVAALVVHDAEQMQGVGMLGFAGQ